MRIGEYTFQDRAEDFDYTNVATHRRKGSSTAQRCWL